MARIKLGAKRLAPAGEEEAPKVKKSKAPKKEKVAKAPKAEKKAKAPKKEKVAKAPKAEKKAKGKKAKKENVAKAPKDVASLEGFANKKATAVIKQAVSLTLKSLPTLLNRAVDSKNVLQQVEVKLASKVSKLVKLADKANAKGEVKSAEIKKGLVSDIEALAAKELGAPTSKAAKAKKEKVAKAPKAEKKAKGKKSKKSK